MASQAANAAPSGGSTARVTSQQLRKADDTVGGWLLGLVDGSGSAPSQIVVTAVLGCVPVVGQLFDLRDLIKCIIALAAPGAGAWAWGELVITLIGCIPGFGDAFKAGVKLARSGAKADRVFDAMRNYARMDPQKALKQLDWAKVEREAVQLLSKMLDGFIDALDGWAVQLIAGRQQVIELIKQLKRIKSEAPKMIKEAVGELKKTVDDLLSQAKVKSSAEVGGKQSPLPSNGAGSGAAGAGKKRDATGEAPAQRGVPNATQIRQSKKKRWGGGVPAQHIVDYHVRETRKPLRKVNENGRLVEEWDRRKVLDDVVVRDAVINTAGIDHLWFGNHRGRKYTVGETKGSVWAQFSFVAGMGQQDKAAVEATRTDTAAVLDDKKEYDAARPMSADKPVNASATISSEAALSDPSKRTGTLKATKTKGRQMSHMWIRMSIDADSSIVEVHKSQLIQEIKARNRRGGSFPYNREVFMVTGKQYEMHDRSKGGRHEVQPPVILIPDNVLSE